MAKKTRRAPGAGHLFTRKSKAGVEAWYGKSSTVDGRQIKRRIGEKRSPGGTRGLTRAEAEKALRRPLADDARKPVSERVTVAIAGKRLAADREALGRKASTIEGIESAIKVHLGPFFHGRSLDRIEAAEVEAFITAKREMGSPRSRSSITCRSCTRSSSSDPQGMGGRQPCETGRKAGPPRSEWRRPFPRRRRP